MTEPQALYDLIHASRRRRIAQLWLDHGALALCLALGALALLLLLGTQILDWYWPPLLLLAGVGYGAWRLRSRVPGSYAVAQEVDERFALSDLLSTAIHFAERKAAGSFAERVFRAAENSAQSIRPAEAMPVGLPRVWRWLLVLCLLSAGLFFWRYGRAEKLSFEAPLIQFDFDPFQALFQSAEKTPKKAEAALPNQPLDVAVPGTPNDPLEELLKQNMAMSVDAPGQEGSSLGNQAGDKRAGNNQKKDGASEEGESGEGSESGDAGKDTPGKGESPNTPDAKTPAKNASDKPEGAKDKNSLLDKMRDAFNNMMDKMKLSPPQTEKSDGGKSGKKSGSDGQQAQKGKASKDGSKQDGKEQADGQDQQPGDAGDSDSQKGQQGQASQDSQSNEPKSGVGQQDGRKEMEEAAQLEAMGKLSEILGKRTQSLQGEITVEVNATKQQLRTPYLNRRAAHGDAGGEVSRDEVPLHLQDYVQRYYEQVRKPAPAAKGGKK